VKCTTASAKLSFGRVRVDAPAGCVFGRVLATALFPFVQRAVSVAANALCLIVLGSVDCARVKFSL
jgi:hypothetical protein